MVDEKRIREYLGRVCARVDGNEVEVDNLLRITTGWETNIYAFTLRYGRAHERSEPMILRLYAGKDGPEKAERESAVMHALHTAGYSVPHVWTVQTATEPLGSPFLLLERIEGPLLLDAFVTAAESRQHELLTLFCRTLADLHALDWRIAPPVLTSWTDRASDPNAPYAFIDAELTMLKRTLDRFPVAQSLLPVLRWLEAHRDEVPCRRLAITHGDFHPNNILLRPDGSPVVIDWGAVAVGDPRLDVAWMLLLTCTLGFPELYEPLLRGYEHRAGVVEQLGYFEVVAAYRRFFDVLVALRAGAEALGMRPGAEALMRQQGAHLGSVYSLLQDRTEGVAVPEIETLLEELD